MSWLDDILEGVRSTIEDIQTKLTNLKSVQDQNVATLDKYSRILAKDSKSLGDLQYTTVFDGVVNAHSGAEVKSAVFDESKTSKDAAGNIVIPHAFYTVSAYVLDATRKVVYNGSIIVGSDITVGIERLTANTPRRFQSRLTVYSVGANIDVYIRVLKLTTIR